MGDDIIDRLQCTYRKDEWPCETCTFCAARAEIERLRADRDRWRELAIDFADAGTHETAHSLVMDDYLTWLEARRG